MILKRVFVALTLTLLAAVQLPAQAAAVFKIATIAPEGSEWMVEHRKAAAEINELTEGRVSLKFYGGGVMGNDRKVLRKIRIGQLQGAAFSTSGLVERYPDIMLYGMPFIFETLDEVDFVRAQLDEPLAEGLKDAGFVSFGFAGGGFANFMSSAPIKNQEDLESKKIWVPEGDNVAFTGLQSMNLSPVVLPLSDVLTGLQTGLLDVIVTSPQGALLLQWYTKVKYINPLPVAYTLGILAVDNRAFERIDAGDQAIFTEVMTNAYQQIELINRRDNIAAADALLENGLEMAASDPEVIPIWHRVAMETNEKIWRESAVDPELYDRMQELLAEYRSIGEAEESVVDSGM